MRFHILSVPHTVVNKDYLSCAFTQNIGMFCKMFKSAENKLFYYGHKRSIVECDEHISVMDDFILHKCYGNYDYKNNLFKFGHNDQVNLIFNKRCIAEIRKRKEKNDFILCFWGLGHKSISDQFSDCIIVEPSIGYGIGAIFAPHKVFVSYAYMHYYYGMRDVKEGKWNDCVIPNYFDTNDFEYKEVKGNYMLYVGRLAKDKGIDICIQLAEKLKIKLILAGPGDLKSLGYDKKNLPKDLVVHVGFADVEKRKELLANAKCLLLPTFYFEPFGCVIIEALLSGTPVITTDWGAFPEINLHGITGYRCRNFEQFCWAVTNIDKINPSICRDWAINNYSVERIKKMYVEYFEMLTNLYNKKGFYEENPSRANLEWLYKKY
ncbi:MAG: glycosyltransferase [Hyperionvirus sp.]|uniref:Glycosyltransferase n=1 Tax=Hyperionvirus sp. TaxID=2487770 RepID=A0A3G5A9A7_9VIRU|nr:MAG: glycosyltransferase [Hyperionvirus sp.]